MCLAAINLRIDITFRLATVTASCMQLLFAARQANASTPANSRGNPPHLLRLVGLVAQNIDFENEKAYVAFERKLGPLKIKWSKPVVQYLLETTLTFCGEDTEKATRSAALEALGMFHLGDLNI